MVAELTSILDDGGISNGNCTDKRVGGGSTQRKPLQLIVVVTDNEQAPPSAQGFPI